MAKLRIDESVLGVGVILEDKKTKKRRVIQNVLKGNYNYYKLNDGFTYGARVLLDRYKVVS